MARLAASSGRGVISLDGTWDFVHHADGAPRRAPVPMPWQAAFADLRQTSGTATYRRQVDVPGPGAVHVLCFGAVSYRAIVRVNGVELTRHDNGWLPFEVALPDSVAGTTIALEVECHLPGNLDGFGETPHGKQSWYGPSGGIWQSVTLQSRPQHHLRHCAIEADISGRVQVALDLTGGTPLMSVLDAQGAVVALGPDLTVPNPLLWSPDQPNLYRLRVELGQDVTEHSFGFRSIETKGGLVLLNGQPFYMRGALDQDYWPVGLATPPSLDALEDQLLKAKALGLNCLRCHIKIPDPRYYEVADRLGMLIWTEIPNVAYFSDTAAAAMRVTMEGILRRDGNHPSICIWTIINEDWGTRLSEDPAHRAWLKAEYDWLKARDPSRLVVENSPCHGNFHVKTDLNDFHWYRSLPERRAEWDTLTAEFATAADWTWTPFGDGERRGDEPLICSEFGVWGLPQPEQVKVGGAEPWWMESGQTWGDGVAYPHGMEQRFAALGLGAVFGDLAGFVDCAQGYQFMNLKYQIESMRGHQAIQGYVVTEFTDVHWESNGLLDMNRNPRAFARDFAQINADVVIVPDVPRYAGVAGQAFRFGLSVATGGHAVLDCMLHWSCGAESGVIAVPATGAAGVRALGPVSLILPATTTGQMARITLRLMSGGRQLAENSLDIAVYAARSTAHLPTVSVPDPDLARWLAGLGYDIAPEGAVTVVDALGKSEIAAMQAGARYLVLADGTARTHRNLRSDEGRREQPNLRIVDDIPGLPANPEAQLPNISLTPRHGTIWRGDWIAGFSWLRRDAAFASIPGGPLLDLSFERVVPHHVMGGFRAWEYGGPVLSGLVVGWCHKPGALIADRIVGRGKLTATTFRLTTETPGTDPVAAALADALVAQALA